MIPPPTKIDVHPPTDRNQVGSETMRDYRSPGGTWVAVVLIVLILSGVIALLSMTSGDAIDPTPPPPGSAPVATVG